MQTVVETPAYLRAAKNAGMSVDEMRAAVDVLARDPAAGVLIMGTRGFRKVRLAGKGHGKSGRYRLITYFAEVALPVVLITVFSKTSAPTFRLRNAARWRRPNLIFSSA